MNPKPCIRRINGVHIMTKLTPSKLLIVLALSSAALLLAACSPSAEKLNNQGNEAFAEQEYLVALHEYQSAQVESPELAEPYYNAANALYREGAYVEALEQMQLALQYLEDETLAEKSIYNLGNTFYNTQELESAVDSYIRALMLDPDDQDAKYNLELALQQQQQEQQEQENQDQEQSESGEDQQNEESQVNQSENGEDQGEEQGQGDQENESQPGSENEDQQNETEQEQNQDQGDSGNQPQDSDEQSDQQGEPGELPPGQRMTEEQARQLLAALAQDMETLQERLGQMLQVQIPPPAQDW
jgi:Ca-activated chloride channel family protein